MNPGLVVFLFLGVIGGLTAAGMALFLGWGWLVAAGLYCLVGSLTLVAAATVSVMIASRPSRNAGDRAQDAAPDPDLVQAFR